MQKTWNLNLKKTATLSLKRDSIAPPAPFITSNTLCHLHLQNPALPSSAPCIFWRNFLHPTVLHPASQAILWILSTCCTICRLQHQSIKDNIFHALAGTLYQKTGFTKLSTHRIKGSTLHLVKEVQPSAPSDGWQATECMVWWGKCGFTVHISLYLSLNVWISRGPHVHKPRPLGFHIQYRTVYYTCILLPASCRVTLLAFLTMLQYTE